MCVNVCSWGGGVGKGVLHCNGVLGGRVGATTEGGGLNEATFCPFIPKILPDAFFFS